MLRKESNTIIRRLIVAVQQRKTSQHYNYKTRGKKLHNKKKTREQDNGDSNNSSVTKKLKTQKRERDSEVENNGYSAGFVRRIRFESKKHSLRQPLFHVSASPTVRKRITSIPH